MVSQISFGSLHVKGSEKAIRAFSAAATGFSKGQRPVIVNCPALDEIVLSGPSSPITRAIDYFRGLFCVPGRKTAQAIEKQLVTAKKLIEQGKDAVVQLDPKVQKTGL